jgi:hypothetical protein
MIDRRRAASIATVAAVAALAFIVACVAHEALAHGLACKAAGGDVVLLTSVYFRCSAPGRFVAAAGPLANIALGVFFATLPRPRQPASALFVGLAAATNLFWGTGYFVFSGLTGTGDMAAAVRDWGLGLNAGWRAALVVGGAAMYFLAIRRLGVLFAPDAPLGWAYLCIGITSCLAALFYDGPSAPALREAFQQGFLATLGLPLIAWLRRGEVRAELPRPHAGWVAGAAVVVPLFICTLGIGLDGRYL